ncbi:MAG: pyridoxamine 5'-phosphate oxidase family protein [Spirochaetales bacterium]|nr:pyridoxamine 5'-phosphate oxidase family protein [Spirochaetales bacterium]
MRRSEKEITEFKTIERILDLAPACRLGFSGAIEPYIVPMNFAWEKKRDELFIYFHCAGLGRKMGLLEKGERICFQTDIDLQIKRAEKACDWGMGFESIIAWGHPFPVKESDEKKRTLNLLMRKHDGGDSHDFPAPVLDRTRVFGLKLEDLTCKKS